MDAQWYIHECFQFSEVATESAVMAISKSSFYIGAAHQQLLSSGESIQIQFRSPFYVLNGDVFCYHKYSAKATGPWGFTLSSEEQHFLIGSNDTAQTWLVLTCGGDGIAAIKRSELCTLLNSSGAAQRIACSRLHGGHYSVSGPRCVLPSKVAPSRWKSVLCSNSIPE
jgi:hypothetical protein